MPGAFLFLARSKGLGFDSTMHNVDRFARHTIKIGSEIGDVRAACHQGIRPLDRDSFHKRAHPVKVAVLGWPVHALSEHGQRRMELHYYRRPVPESAVQLVSEPFSSVFGEIDYVELGRPHAAMKVAEDVPCITDRVSGGGVDGKVSSRLFSRRAHP